jgi:hypothetical protein
MSHNNSNNSFIRKDGQPRPEQPPQLKLRPGEISPKNPKPNSDSSQK